MPSTAVGTGDVADDFEAALRTGVSVRRGVGVLVCIGCLIFLELLDDFTVNHKIQFQNFFTVTFALDTAECRVIPVYTCTGT